MLNPIPTVNKPYDPQDGNQTLPNFVMIFTDEKVKKLRGGGVKRVRLNIQALLEQHAQPALYVIHVDAVKNQKILISYLPRRIITT